MENRAEKPDSMHKFGGGGGWIFNKSANVFCAVLAESWWMTLIIVVWVQGPIVDQHPNQKKYWPPTLNAKSLSPLNWQHSNAISHFTFTFSQSPFAQNAKKFSIQTALDYYKSVGFFAEYKPNQWWWWW